MKAYQFFAILGFLAPDVLGAAIPSSTNSRSIIPIQAAHVPSVLQPAESLPTDLFAPVRRDEEPSAPDPSISSGKPSTAGGDTGSGAGGGPFVAYSGPSSSFPPRSQWAPFEFLWAQNTPHMKTAGNSDQENDWIKTGIITVAASSGVDARAILATIIQESTGNVRVQSTHNVVHNPGLMQSHGGVSFDPADPQGSILQMIRDGTEGTAGGDGLKQTLAAQNGNYYEAFRKYNSGSCNKAQLNDGLGSMTLYVQQMANRVMGAVSVTP